MKRNEHIIPLSQDHHHGLLFCWKIRQGMRNGIAVERMQGYIHYFWKEHLEQHFAEEETLLFAGLQDPLVDEALKQHVQIRTLLTLAGEPAASPALLTDLATTLDDHIRFEERVVFPHLEQLLSGERLSALGKQLQLIHQVKKKDDYTDEFWIQRPL